MVMENVLGEDTFVEETGTCRLQEMKVRCPGQAWAREGFLSSSLFFSPHFLDKPIDYCSALCSSAI